MASPVTNAITTRWVQDGTAAAVLEAVRIECTARQALAATHLVDCEYAAHPESFHLWLHLPPSLNVLEFAAHLRLQGATVVAGAAFSTDGNPPHAVRVSLGGPIKLPDCDAMLRLIVETMSHPRHEAATVI